MRRLTHQSEGCQSLRHEVDHVQVQLGVHRGVDRLLAQRHQALPGHVLPLRGSQQHGDGPGALSESRAVREGENHWLPQLLGGLAGAGQYDGAEQSLAWLDVWI